MRRGPAEGGLGVLENPIKPRCYDLVPACLCVECQRYDVLMSSRSDPSTFWSTCVPSAVAKSTCGLACVDALQFDNVKRICLHEPNPNVPDVVDDPDCTPVYLSFSSRPRC